MNGEMVNSDQVQPNALGGRGRVEGLRMIIQSLKQHFPARFPEWLSGGIMFAWGVYVALHPGIFTNPETGALFQGMVDMVKGLGSPAGVWGIFAAVAGCIRLSALLVNGLHTRTPLVRLIMSFVSAFVWSQVFIGLWGPGIANPAMIVYGGLVFADLCSAYRAGYDVIYSERSRRNVAELQRRVAGSGSPR